MNNILDPNIQCCSGCAACLSICPKNAIEYSFENGFYKTKIDINKCVSCGLCKKVCYRFNSVKENEIKKENLHCAQIKDKDILFKSSSGGMSYALMCNLIDNGFIVYGFSYDYESNECVLSKAFTKEECLKFIGSKYMQANVYNDSIYNELLQFERKTKLAFFGTPCFISGIKLFLEHYGFKDYVLVDIFCHGVPTPLLWKSYISQFNNVKSVKFRNKKYGWHNYSSSISTDKKDICKKNDLFYDLYFSNLFMNDSCLNCNIRKKFNSDIRIGDAWGYSYDKNKDGVSVIVCNTEKGKNMYANLTDSINKLKSINVDELYNFQSVFDGEKKISLEKRNNVFKIINKDFNSIYKYYLKQKPLVSKIKLNFKHLFNILPYSFKQTIKYKNHIKQIKSKNSNC